MTDRQRREGGPAGSTQALDAERHSGSVVPVDLGLRDIYPPGLTDEDHSRREREGASVSLAEGTVTARVTLKH